MSSVKETYFFERDDYRESLEDYARYFPAGTAIRGEATPSYSQHPRVKHIPERIHSIIPNAKLIYLVRDPLDRAEAQYQQRVSVGDESRPIAEAFADVEDPFNIYACCSKYALQVSRYLRLFPEANLLIVDSRDLAQQPQETLSEVFRFIGVDPNFRSSEFSERLNTQAEKVRLSGIGTRLRRSGAATGARSVLPESVRARVFPRLRRGLSRDVQRVPLAGDIRARLADVLHDDVAEFRRFTGRHFEHWSI
jgi:hypothetical protein